MLIRQETRAFKSLCVAMDLNAESLRKEVIHPQIPLGIPCYDLVLIANFTLAPAKLGLRVPLTFPT